MCGGVRSRTTEPPLSTVITRGTSASRAACSRHVRRKDAGPLLRKRWLVATALHMRCSWPPHAVILGGDFALRPYFTRPAIPPSVSLEFQRGPTRGDVSPSRACGVRVAASHRFSTVMAERPFASCHTCSRRVHREMHVFISAKAVAPLFRERSPPHFHEKAIICQAEIG